MKKGIILLLVAFAITVCAFVPQLKVSSAVVFFKNVTANLPTNGSNTATRNGIVGGTPAINTNTDTSIAMWQCVYNSDIIIMDSIVKTSGYLRGTVKLQGCGDTANGGRWFTVRGLTTTVVGASDSVFTIPTGGTSCVANWYVQRFPYEYGRLLAMSDTTEVYTQKPVVRGKW